MPPPSVVLDTNVIVSSYLKQDGLERFVFDMAIAGNITFYVSREILEEYSFVLRRKKFRLSPSLVARSLDLIRRTATIVQPSSVLSVSPDADDNKFLECAEKASADYLVTGNKRHFPRTWGVTRIVNAREFLDETISGLKR